MQDGDVLEIPARGRGRSSLSRAPTIAADRSPLPGRVRFLASGAVPEEVDSQDAILSRCFGDEYADHLRSCAAAGDGVS